MNPFNRSQGHVIKTNLRVCPDVIKTEDFRIEDIIKHLRSDEENIVLNNPIYKELFDICVDTLSEVKDELVHSSQTSLSDHAGLRARTFFYPSCRIIHVNLINTARATRSTVRRFSSIEQETGYNMSTPKWSHSSLVIKIERMTDTSCFASWSLIS